ncbi:MAG: hypothetical protein ACOYNN_19055, partial [Terrimicrobiaceae bacterium]
TLLKFSNSTVYSPSTVGSIPGFTFGNEYGTWYQYTSDPNFNSEPVIGKTQGSNQLLSYNSMYYMVPFNSDGSNITYCRLTGSAVPYPLSQVISTGTTYFGQTALVPDGIPQLNYCMPSTIANALPSFGPQNGVAYTQSQYEQSQPITTTSLGYRSNAYLIRTRDTLYSFSTCFTTATGILPRERVGITTHVSEYNESLYFVNSLSNYSGISNAPLGFLGASYASSISSAIQGFNGTVSSIHFLVSTPSTLQNYPYPTISSFFSSITYRNDQPGTQISTTVLSYTFDVANTLSTTVWMWGGGGATQANASISSYGGAGAYVKANLNVQTLYTTYRVSTVYMVVGKGGNRKNPINIPTQQRYGGGGASALGIRNPTEPENSISLQGGGFSGIFVESTLQTPILIVGGGGAGGASTLGGPGGFGPITERIPIQYYRFSTVALTTSSFSTFAIESIEDIDSNPFSADTPIASTIDGNPLTYWTPLNTVSTSIIFNTVSTVSTLITFSTVTTGTTVTTFSS